MLIDSVAITISFFTSFLLRFDLNLPNEYMTELLFLLPVLIFLHIIIFNIYGFYDIIWRFTSFLDMINIIKATSIANLIAIFFLTFSKAVIGYPRSIILIFYLLHTLSICITRIGVRLYHTHYFNNPLVRKKKLKRLVLIGAGKTGEKIAREIINTHDISYKAVGFADDDLSIRGSTLHTIKVFGPVKDLPNFDLEYDEILITAPSATGDQLRNILKVCKATGKKYKIVPGLNDLIDKSISIAAIRNVSYVDLLGRDEVKLDLNSIENVMTGKRVLITGAGGSIGSELIRQCLIFKPSEIICLDISEENIFNIEQELGLASNDTILKYTLCNINNLAELEKPFIDNRPQIVFHAAAYKHVPLQELHPWSAVKTNVGGTLNLVNLSNKHSVELFVLVSTDKAVNPVNVMGATKRAAEKIIQSFNMHSKTCFMAVRFGNVLGSSGSAIPIFQKQINGGGPLTVTHPEMKRYFMSIQEASQLILQCCALGKDGEIFLLKMGKPINIYDMAKDLIRLSGLEPGRDIPIVFTGLRPGEKLYEELQLKNEKKIYTQHEKIMILDGNTTIESWESLKSNLQDLIIAGEQLDSEQIQICLKKVLPTYKPQLSNVVNLDKTNKFDKEKIQA